MPKFQLVLPLAAAKSLRFLPIPCSLFLSLSLFQSLRLLSHHRHHTTLVTLLLITFVKIHLSLLSQLKLKLQLKSVASYPLPSTRLLPAPHQLLLQQSHFSLANFSHTHTHTHNAPTHVHSIRKWAGGKRI